MEVDVDVEVEEKGGLKEQGSWMDGHGHGQSHSWSTKRAATAEMRSRIAHGDWDGFNRCLRYKTEFDELAAEDAQDAQRLRSFNYRLHQREAAHIWWSSRDRPRETTTLGYRSLRRGVGEVRVVC